MDNDDLKFGSIFTLIAAIVSGLVCFFGSSNSIVWLSIVGIVLTVVAVCISLIPNKIGIIASIMIVVLCYLGRSWFSGSDNAILSWLYTSESDTDVLFFTKICVIVCIELLIVSVINLSTAVNYPDE